MAVQGLWHLDHAYLCDQVTICLWGAEGVVCPLSPYRRSMRAVALRAKRLQRLRSGSQSEVDLLAQSSRRAGQRGQRQAGVVLIE